LYDAGLGYTVSNVLGEGGDEEALMYAKRQSQGKVVLFIPREGDPQVVLNGVAVVHDGLRCRKT